MGVAERLEEGEAEEEKRGELVGSGEAKVLLRLSAYLAPTELHKLRFRLHHQRDRRSGTGRRGMTAVGEEGENILTEFDRIALTSQVIPLLLVCATKCSYCGNLWAFSRGACLLFDWLLRWGKKRPNSPRVRRDNMVNESRNILLC